MYYIFNSEDILIGWCEYIPNMEDLTSRCERYAESLEEVNNPFSLVIGKYGTLFEPAPIKLSDEARIEQESNRIKKIRDVLLNNTDWITTRHFEEKMSGKETTLSDTQISEFLNYRQALRDITQIEGFPFVVIPQQPKFLE